MKIAVALLLAALMSPCLSLAIGSSPEPRCGAGCTCSPHCLCPIQQTKHRGATQPRCPAAPKPKK